MNSTAGFSQSVADNYANNGNSIDWQQLQTPHFQIVFSPNHPSITEMAARAEQIYQEYSKRMGVSPPQLTLYIKNESTVVSGKHARDIDDEYSVWQQDLIAPDAVAPDDLRTEIAYAFTEYVKRFPIDYWFYLFSRPQQSPWSDGWVSYLSNPSRTAYVSEFIDEIDQWRSNQSVTDKWFNLKRGRSQIHYFTDRFGQAPLQSIYANRQSLLGLVDYFDFNTPFKRVAELSYDDFQIQWQDSLLNGPMQAESTGKPMEEFTRQSQMDATSLEHTPYRSFWNTRWERPFIVPYYLSGNDFGLGGYLSLKEPMRTHQFDFYGLFSVADPLYKSYFYTEYVNNSFRPRLELSYNHLASTEWRGKARQVETTDVLALSSLWKLTGISEGHSSWYAGLTLRHLALDYRSLGSQRFHHPDIYFDNRKTRQTDLKATLTWRSLKQHPDNLIHPPDGKGLRFMATGADKVLGSQVQYGRFSIDGYSVLPAIGDHRIFLYANGVLDAGDPVGRDYLSFADNGDYKLPGPDFMGSINPGVDRFIRGYTTPLLGDRFLFGKVEYRIPFQVETTNKIFGFIPPARTSLTFFSDGGVMGEARISPTETSTEYRYSVGAEVKRVFSFGGSFRVTYELGFGQPLDEPFGLQPYFNVRSALPF